MIHHFQTTVSKSPELPATLPDGSPWPKISIVTPSYNQGKYIESTILSVLGQKYPNVEHIIVDACSTDSTPAILDKYRSRLSKVIQESDKGQSDAINKGMRLATGDILTWLNSDDMLAPGSLAAIAMGFYLSGADIVAGMCEVFSNNIYRYSHLTSCVDGPLSAEEISDLNGYWMQGKFFYQPEAMFTRDLWERSGGCVREDLHWCMDIEMWLRFAAHNATIHVINAPVAMFRVHEEQKTSDTEVSPKEYIPVANEWRMANGLSALPNTLTGYQEKRPLCVYVENNIPMHFYSGQQSVARVVTSLRASGVACVFLSDDPHDISFRFSADGKLTAYTADTEPKPLEVLPCVEEYLFYPVFRQKFQQHSVPPKTSFRVALYSGHQEPELSMDSVARIAGAEVIDLCEDSLFNAAEKRAAILRSVDCFIYQGSAESADAQFLTEAVFCGVPCIAFVSETNATLLKANFPWVHYVNSPSEEWTRNLPQLIDTVRDKALWSQIHASSYLPLSRLWRGVYQQIDSNFELKDFLKKNLCYTMHNSEDSVGQMSPETKKCKNAMKRCLPNSIYSMLRKIYVFLKK